LQVFEVQTQPTRVDQCTVGCGRTAHVAGFYVSHKRFFYKDR